MGRWNVFQDVRAVDMLQLKPRQILLRDAESRSSAVATGEMKPKQGSMEEQ
jgi:hypothetical protein